MRLDVGKININLAKVHLAMQGPKGELVLQKKLLEIKGVAIAIFQSQVRHTHGITYPMYVSSFRIDKIPGRWRLTNDDPAAFWVEFGAYLHHPTHPRILKYHPIMRAVDVVEGGDV